MKKWIPAAIAGVIIAGGAALALNANSDNKSNSGSSDAVSGKVLALGSTALQPLAEAVATQFQEANPEVTVTVQGGGSGSGLTAAADGTAQIGNSDVFAEHKDGVDASVLVDHKVAVIGMTPVVNPEVDVDDLTTEQLRGIFTGKIKNWNEVGGKDQAIVVINREDGSGTRKTFEDAVLASGESAVKSQEQSSTGAMISTVASTPGAIGYVAFSGLKDDVKALKVDGVEPKNENVATNDWKIWSYEHMYTKGEPEGATKAYLDFILSDDVQEKTIPELGFISISDMKVEKNADGEVEDK
jgi:phosphate transport system substrate-binding protein